MSSAELVELHVDNSRLAQAEVNIMAGNPKIKLDAFIKERIGKKAEVEAAFNKKQKLDEIASVLPQMPVPPPTLDIEDWSAVKKAYATPDTTFQMLTMLIYRKQVVDGKISALSKGRPIVVKSVGSTDLTSDYDITIGISGGDVSGAELDVIQQFNDFVRITYGKQSGTIFDTNLYAKDFLPLDSNDKRLALPEVSTGMYNMMVEGQDVGALVKQRRYMSYDGWLGFLNTLVGESGNAATITRNRYETADAQYLLNVAEMLNEFATRASQEAKSKAIPSAFLDAQKKVEAAVTEAVLSPGEQAFVKNAANKDMAKAQLLLRYKALKWEHDYPDLTLWVTNDLYLKKMRAIRLYQNVVEESKQVKDDVGEANPNPASSDAEKALLAELKLHSGDVRVADLISSAIFFASEAYLSEGALRHVVDGVQVAKSNPNLQGEALARAINATLMGLSIEQLLQSINEQFGDFLKDFAHYGDTPEFLYRGAKYIQRLFEAASFLAAKKQSGTAAEQSSLGGLDMAVIDRIFGKPAAAILDRLNTKGEGLVAVRKGEKTFAASTGRETYCAAEAKTYFQAENGKALRDKISQMVLKLNAQVRSRLTSTPPVEEIKAYFKALRGSA